MATRTYEPRGGARELLLSRAPSVLVSGPAGTGKSVAALTKIHLTSLMVPGCVTLLLRQTAASLAASTIQTYEKSVATQELSAGEVVWFGGSGSKPAAFRYRNGSLIIPGGMDQPGKFLSMDVDRVLIDECNQVSRVGVETVLTRLRGSAGTYRQAVFLTNPDHPDHHLLQMVQEGRAEHIHSLHRDNPFLFGRDGTPTEAGREYLSRLDSLTGIRRARYRDGIWAAAEGLIYGEAWSDGRNLIDWFEVPKEWPLFLTVDFGYSNPFVCQWWRVDPDGRMYLTREIHQTQTLVEDHARHIRQIVDEHPGEPRPMAIVCDHDSEDRATLERHLKMPTVAARKGVTRGVQLTEARLRPAGDGRPRLLVFKGAVVGRDLVAEEQKRPRGFASEINAYVWQTERGDDGIPKETPLKKHDHSMDAGRYAVAFLDWNEPVKAGNPARAQQVQRPGSKWATPTGKPGKKS